MTIMNDGNDDFYAEVNQLIDEGYTNSQIREELIDYDDETLDDLIYEIRESQ